MQNLAELLPSIEPLDKASIDYRKETNVSSIETIENNTLVEQSKAPFNPIVPIEAINDAKTVDYLLLACSDIIDARYKPFFAKRFYRFERNSVLAAASLSRLEGRNPQRFFSNLVKAF